MMEPSSGRYLEGFVGIDLIEHPQAVRHELQVVRLRAAGDLVEPLDAFLDQRRVGRRSGRERRAEGGREGGNPRGTRDAKLTCVRHAWSYIPTGAVARKVRSALAERRRLRAQCWRSLERKHMTTHRVRVFAALTGFAGLMAGIALTSVLQGQAPAPAAGGRKSDPSEKIPNTGLPYSPGIRSATRSTCPQSGTKPGDRRALVPVASKPRHARIANMREVLKAASMDFKDVRR